MMWRHTVTRKARGRLRAAVRGIAGILLTVALVTGALRAGGHYFYCATMGVVLTDPCVTPASHGRELATGIRDELCGERTDCCKVGTFAAIPEGARPERSSIAPAPILATLSRSQILENQRAPQNESDVASRARGRAPPPLATERRARLMVFLT